MKPLALPMPVDESRVSRGRKADGTLSSHRPFRWAGARPRLGGISFLHRFGSALNHHVHLHACVTDGVFLTTAAEAARDTPPAFLPARPITQADLAALTERAPRRVIRWFRHADLVPARVHPLPKILFTACFVHGLPLRVGRPSAFRASHTC